MSFVQVHIPDDGWFQSGCNTYPKDKQLCLAISRYGGQKPDIYQFRKADWLHPHSDYFLDVSEKWRMEENDIGAEEWEPGFMTMDIIECWKPLGLPSNVNERILIEIVQWFEPDK